MKVSDLLDEVYEDFLKISSEVHNFVETIKSDQRPNTEKIYFLFTIYIWKQVQTFRLLYITHCK